jgi:hypothetical protein
MKQPYKQIHYAYPTSIDAEKYKPNPRYKGGVYMVIPANRSTPVIFTEKGGAISFYQSLPCVSHPMFDAWIESLGAA